MAKLVEEEENYWPGFVDALSTIVMVVTFLLIILGVVIFAISTQVSKALSEGTMISEQAIAQQTSSLTAALAQSQQQVTALTLQQAEAREAADAMAQSQQEAQAQAAAIEQQLQAMLVAETNARTSADSANTQLLSVSATVAQQAQALAEQQQENQQLADQAATAQAALDAVTAQAEARRAELAETTRKLEEQSQTVAELTAAIATQTPASSAPPTADEAVEADNTLQISSRAVIDPTEITVAAEEDSRQEQAVLVTSAREVLTVRFPAGSVDMSAEANAEALAFVDANQAILASRTISLWSFYDGGTLAITQAKRSAYFRLLAVRNALLEGAVEGANIDISVRVAEASGDVDTVKAFLQ